MLNDHTLGILIDIECMHRDLWCFYPLSMLDPNVGGQDYSSMLKFNLSFVTITNALSRLTGVFASKQFEVVNTLN